MKKRLVVLLLCGMTWCGQWVSIGHAMDPIFKASSPLIGKTLPNFEVYDMNWETKNFASIRKGNRAILFFWATWCPHCRTQLKEIENNRSALEKEGIEIILINVGEKKKDVAAYLQRSQLPVEGYLDWDGAVSEQFGVFGLPTFIFVDKVGIVSAFEHQLPRNFSNYFAANR